MAYSVYALLLFFSALCHCTISYPSLKAILVQGVRLQAEAAIINCSVSRCSAMDMFPDLSCLGDDDFDMDESDEETEMDRTDDLLLPLEAPNAACPRSISLSSLWPCPSTFPSAETDDVPICHRESASSSCSQSGHQFRVRLENVSHSSSPSAVLPPRNISLDMVFPASRDQVLTWHPNRVLSAVIDVIYHRLSQVSSSRRRCRGKQSDFRKILQHWMATRQVTASGNFRFAHRMAGRDLYRRILAILTGKSSRELKSITGPSWAALSVGNRNSWAQMAELLKHREVHKCAREFWPDQSKNRMLTHQARQERSEITDDMTCRGYGVSVCINTSLGQDDVHVIRILQSGLSGQELRTALAEVACYSKFIDACWAYFSALGQEHGMPLVACGLEHSENGSHPARVHVHVFMGVELRGAFFQNNAAMSYVPFEKLTWNGIKPGFVRATLVPRRTHSQIHKAVIQSYYYVAGPKKSQMLLRCSAHPHKEHGQVAGNTPHIFLDSFKACRFNVVRFAFVAIQSKKLSVKDCSFFRVAWKFDTLLNPLVNVSCYLFNDRIFQFLLE